MPGLGLFETGADAGQRTSPEKIWKKNRKIASGTIESLAVESSG